MKVSSILMTAVTGVGAAIGAGAVVGSQAITPPEPDLHTDAVAAVVADATPDQHIQDPIEVDQAPEGYVAQADAADVTIPQSASEPVVVDIDGETRDLHISLTQDAIGGAHAELANDGTVVYAGDHTQQSVQVVDEGVRIYTVITSADSPTEFVHEVLLPEGARLVEEHEVNELLDVPARHRQSGAIYVLRGDDSTLGVFDEPWAVDANGEPVPTRYEIREGQIVQIVEHSSATAYPVVADPFFGIFRSFIHSAQWETNDVGQVPARGERRLLVTPTEHAKNSGLRYSYALSGWNELNRKFGQSLSIDYNRDSMRDQWICHQIGASFMPQDKATWNLEEWRPVVGVTDLLAAKCNPETGSVPGSSR